MYVRVWERYVFDRENSREPRPWTFRGNSAKDSDIFHGAGLRFPNMHGVSGIR